MALAIISTLVVLPLFLLFIDLLRPARQEPAAFAGPPSGKQRPVPRFIPQEGPAEREPSDAPVLDEEAPVQVEAAPTAVRAPIGASLAGTPILATGATLRLPAPHVLPRASAPAALLATVPATAGTAPAAALPAHRDRALPSTPVPATPAEGADPFRALVPVDRVDEQRRRRTLLPRAQKKGPLAPTGGRRDYFGDGLLAGTVAQRTDAA